MKQRGWTMVMVVMLCGLMAAATLGVALDLGTTQRGLNQRQTQLHAQAAAEALIRQAQRSGASAPAAPVSGCALGRCAWMGDGALIRSAWAQWLQAGVPAGGWAGDSAWTRHWPTLPRAQLTHWAESTTTADGVLWRYTAWVGDASGRPWTVMQAVWLIPASGSGGQWVSWREVMP